MDLDSFGFFGAGFVTTAGFCCKHFASNLVDLFRRSLDFISSGAVIIILLVCLGRFLETGLLDLVDVSEREERLRRFLLRSSLIVESSLLFGVFVFLGLRGCVLSSLRLCFSGLVISGALLGFLRFFVLPTVGLPK
jgi:hypothetical protein